MEAANIFGAVGITIIENLVEWDVIIFIPPQSSNVFQARCCCKTEFIKAHDSLIQNPKYASSSDTVLVLSHLRVDIPIWPTPHRKQITSVPTAGRVCDKQ
jgi:hypothetical protein